MKKLMIVIMLVFALILLSNIVLAANKTMIEIESLTAYVDGDEDKSVDETGGTIDVEPEQTIKLKVKVHNMFERSTDVEVEDIKILGTLIGVDNGDDLEVELDKFDLEADRSKTVTLEFNVPLKVEEDQFELLIEIKADDINDTEQNLELSLDVDVEKEGHLLAFDEIRLLDSKLECTRTTQLEVTLVNIGAESEDDIELSVTSNDLDLSLTENIDEMPADPWEDNTESFNIDATNAKAGIHPVLIQAKYNNGRDTIKDTVEVTVVSCAANEPEPEPEPDTTEPESDTVEPDDTEPDTTDDDIDVASTDTAGRVVAGKATTSIPKDLTSVSKNTWWNNNKWIAIILITDAVLVVVGILIFAAKRRR